MLKIFGVHIAKAAKQHLRTLMFHVLQIISINSSFQGLGWKGQWWRS